MNSPLYLFLVILHGLLLGYGIYTAYRQNRPALLTVCTTLLAMNVVFANLASENAIGLFYDNDREKTTLAQFYCTISDLILLVVNFPSITSFSAWVGQLRSESRARFNALSHMDRGALLITSFGASMIGFASSVIKFAYHGGVEEVWTRASAQEEDPTPFKGLLTITSYFVLFYPYTVCYLYNQKLLTRYFHLPLAGFLFVAAFGIFAVSGTTTGPLLSVLPIGFMLVQKDNAMSMKRFLICVVLMALAITVLRFARHLGKVSAGGADGLAVTGESMSGFSDSEIGMTNSFVMLQAFAQVIHRIDYGDRMLWGGSYLMIPVGVIPGSLYPGGPVAKSRFMLDNRPDVYTLEKLTSRTFMGWLPSGYYGEAYINFGLAGLVGISFVVGAIVLTLDSRFNGKFLGLPGTYMVPLMISPVVDSIRMYMSDAFNLALCQVVLFAVMIHLTRLVYPYWIALVAIGPARRGRARSLR